VTYKYYLLGESVPIRVSFNENGHKFGAEVPGDTQGELLYKNMYLGRIEQSFEVDEISEDEFRKQCELVWGRRGSKAGLER